MVTSMFEELHETGMTIHVIVLLFGLVAFIAAGLIGWDFASNLPGPDMGAW